jgi:hypothetical protein
MIFSNKRSYISTTNTNHPRSQMSYTSTQKPKDSIMPLLSRHVPKNVAVVRSTTYVEKVETQNESKKIKWGEPFWNLFHVLAEKVKESEFQRIRVDFLNFIYLICSNLPCPDCTTHAVHYLNGINFNAITTKEELKNMLFDFHNSVNARKGYPLFPRCELDNKYRSGNTRLIIDTFLLHFKSRPYSVRLFTDTLHRERVMKNIISWFEKNITCFL